MKNNKEIEELKRINKELLLLIFIFIIVLIGVFIFYSLKLMPSQNSQACVPKMQGFYQNMKDNYAVVIISTNNAVGQQFAGEVQAAINQINSLQIKGGAK
jgi:C4-dicarboxylate transporter